MLCPLPIPSVSHCSRKGVDLQQESHCSLFIYLINLEVAILDFFGWEQGPQNSGGHTSKHDRTVCLVPPVSICALILDLSLGSILLHSSKAMIGCEV